MRTVLTSAQDQLHGQSARAISCGLCFKRLQAWGLMLYSCHLEILNNSNIFNFSVKSDRIMGHEWGRLGSLAHIQFCLLLPLPILNYLLLSFPPSSHLGTAATHCAQMCPVPAHRYGEGLRWMMHPAVSWSILVTKHIVAQRLQSLGGGQFTAGWRRGLVGRGDAWINSSTVVGAWGISLMAGGRRTF